MTDSIEVKDNVVIVTPQDEEVATLDKFVAHRHPAQLHRAISVWMISNDGKILFQKRSAEKIVGAEWWGNTVCGNVWPGESYEECARRRLDVELGIQDVELVPLIKFHYKTFANEEYAEHEMDQVFIAHVDEKQLTVSPNPAEASAIVWVDQKEFFQEVDQALEQFRNQTGRNYPVAAQTVAMTIDELRKWTKPLSLPLAGEERVIVPWSIIMAQMPELRLALIKVD
jgi:isopentenyl-diphosphate Delta-isomerase